MDDDTKRTLRGIILVVAILAVAVATYSFLTAHAAVEKTKADAAAARLEEMRQKQGDAAPPEVNAQDTPPPSGPTRRGPVTGGP